MTQLIQCDGCGRTVEQSDPRFFSVYRNGDGWSEAGDFCPQCVSETVADGLTRTRFDEVVDEDAEVDVDDD